jgi:tRNA threonylcarbamoyladenosine biosynthesis protein TsaB
LPLKPLTLLVFDTAAAHCAAAILRGDDIVVAQIEPMKTGQAERLVPLLESLLEQAGLVWADLDGLGVGIGPGNFTGVRLGVAAAKGLSMALKVPAVGISSLDMRAADVGQCEVIVPATRGQAYAQRFDDGVVQSEIEIIEVDEPPATPPINLARMAWLTAQRLAETTSAPAPIYLRPADAAPGADAPPRILNAG